MGYSAALRLNLHLFSSHPHPPPSEVSWRRFEWKQKNLVVGTDAGAKHRTLNIVKSVLSGKSGVHDNWAGQSTRILLEQLFAKTQKLEQQGGRDSIFAESVQGHEVDPLESDLLAVLGALKKKEEDLQDAERKVSLEHGELICAKEKLERREKAIADASTKHERLELELKQATLSLASQVRNIEELKLQLKEKDREIAAVKSAVTLKEDELNKMKNELMEKSEEAAKIDSELKLKATLLDEANEVVNKQQLEILQLQKAVREREKEVEVSATLRKMEEEKLEVVKSNLEKQTREWLLTQEELKMLAGEASKHAGEANDTGESFRRLKRLLADVRAELVSSQKSLAHSRNQMEQQEQLLTQQFSELEEQKKSIQSYMTSLKDAQMEIESERVKHRAAEARSKELERDVQIERELMQELKHELEKTKFSLQQEVQEISSLQFELDKKNIEFEKMHTLLQGKESELVEAKIEIQQLEAELASLQIAMEEKDSQLFSARKKLEEVNQEVAELKILLRSKEDQLVDATMMLKEKEEHVHMIQDELNETKMRVAEAETVVEQIVELTDELVTSTKNKDYAALQRFNGVELDITQQTADLYDNVFNLQKKQLETELNLTRESLKMKELEVLAANRALVIKDEELKTVLLRLDSKDRELRRLKEEMIVDGNDLKKLHALAQEVIGDKTLGDLAIEKLQLEAAQLEVQAATCALLKLADMSRELLNRASMSIDVDTNDGVLLQNCSDPDINTLENNECFQEVKTKVIHLSTLTEQLVKQAGISVHVDHQKSGLILDSFVQ